MIFAERDADFLSELVLSAVAEVERKAADAAEAQLGRGAPTPLPFVP